MRIVGAVFFALGASPDGGSPWLQLVPFVLSNVIGNEQMMQRDRVHPNAAGARAIADNIWPYLKPLVEHAEPTK